MFKGIQGAVGATDEIYEPQPKQVFRPPQPPQTSSGNLPSIGQLPLPPIFEDGESLLSTNEQNWMNEFFDILGTGNPSMTGGLSQANSPNNSSGNLPIFNPLGNSITPPIQPGIIHSPIQGYSPVKPGPGISQPSLPHLPPSHLVIPHLNHTEHFAIQSLHKLSRSASPRIMESSPTPPLYHPSPLPHPSPSPSTPPIVSPQHSAQHIQSVVHPVEPIPLHTLKPHVMSQHNTPSPSTSPSQDYTSTGNAGTNKKRKKRDNQDSKRQNHLLSEQKRRQAIRQGFENISSIVPGLKLSKSATGAGGTSKSVILLRTAHYLDHLRYEIDTLQQRCQLLEREWHEKGGGALKFPSDPIPIHIQREQDEDT